jgi:thiamine phosphate synthase YjbQ (UPF0047 family)
LDRADLFCDSIEISAETGPDIVDVTEKLAFIIQRAGIEDGSLHASIIGSTAVGTSTLEEKRG